MRNAKARSNSKSQHPRTGVEAKVDCPGNDDDESFLDTYFTHELLKEGRLMQALQDVRHELDSFPKPALSPIIQDRARTCTANRNTVHFKSQPLGPVMRDRTKQSDAALPLNPSRPPTQPLLPPELLKPRTFQRLLSPQCSRGHWRRPRAFGFPGEYQGKLALDKAQLKLDERIKTPLLKSRRELYESARRIIGQGIETRTNSSKRKGLLHRNGRHRSQRSQPSAIKIVRMIYRNTHISPNMHTKLAGNSDRKTRHILF